AWTWTVGAVAPQRDGERRPGMSSLRYRTWAMKHFAALDVSLKQTSVCIVDDAGGIVREAKGATEPDDLRTFFRGTGLTFERIGLEAGPLSQWLHAGLTTAGLPAICVETRHAKAVLSGIANKMVCPGW